MFDSITDVIALIIILIAAVYGAIKLFRHDRPLYFQILVGAVFCYLLQEVSITIDSTYGIELMSAASTSNTVSILACACLFAAAEKKILDIEHVKKKSAVAIGISVIIALIFIAMAYSIFPHYGVLTTVLLLSPACAVIPASYFIVSHIVFSGKNQLLATTKAFPIIELCVFLAQVLFLIAVTYSNKTACDICNIACSTLLAIMTILAAKGAEKWKI